MNQIKSFVQENVYLKKVFATLCILYGIGFLAIIRANVLYRDDIIRTFTGGHYWLNWSRYGSDILCRFIHTTKTLADISPLTQIFAILALALASTILIHIFSEKKSFSFLTCFAVLPLGMSPYFLECFSYKFDAPYMAFSVLAAVFPLLFCRYKDLKSLIGYGVACILCGIFICSTYQVSLGIFPMAILFLSAISLSRTQKSTKEVLKFMSVSIAFYLVGVLIFRLFLMKTVSLYASNIVFPLNELFSGCISNLKTYYVLVWEDLYLGWKILAALIFLSYMVLFTLKNQKNKVAAFFISVLVLLLGAVLSFPYIIFDKPLLWPRGMYGFGAFLALVALQCCTLARTPFPKILPFCLSWCFFSFAFVYGNALYQHNQWKDFKIHLVVSDLNQIVRNENTYTFQVSGSVGEAPSIAKKRHPKILDRILPIAEEFTFEIRNYFDFQNFRPEDKSLDLNTLDLTILKETKYHTIKGDDEHILVLLR